jgi:hypothetical protein
VSRDLLRRVAHEVTDPFRGGAILLGAFASGSRVLLRHWWRWAMAAADRKGVAERLAASSAVAWMALWLIHRYPNPGVPAIASAWCVAAWTLAPPRPARKRRARNDHGDDQEAGETTTPDPDALTQTLGHVVLEAVTAAVADGRKGVHVNEILRQLHEAGLGADWTVTTLREHIERIGIPIRRNLKLRDRGNSYGVHVDDLTAAVGPLDHALATLRATPAEHPPGTPAEGSVEGPAEAPVEVAVSTPASPSPSPHD